MPPPSLTLVQPLGISTLMGEPGGRALMLWAGEGLRDPVRSSLFFLTEFAYEPYRKEMVCPGLWVFPGCGNSGLKTWEVPGNLG